ncbi:MAG: bacteriophage Gp15 family protein [Ruthenibacterium sp.]
MSRKTPNIVLEDGLPEQWDGLPIYADYRNMVRFEQALCDDTLSPPQKISIGVRQLFDTEPRDAQQAAAMMDYLLWFYQCGRNPSENRAGQSQNAERAYDFAQDAPCMLAAFWQSYGIDLAGVPFLHWWKFVALLEHLPEDTRMAQLMGYRTMDTSQIKDTAQRRHYEELKRRFALTTVTRLKSVEELNAQTRERVQRRFAQAKKAVESQP